MKNLLLTLAALVSALSAATAQGRGTVGLGPRLGVYAHTGGEPVYGVGVEARVNMSDPIRIVPSLTWLFNENCSVEMACDMHLMLRTAELWYVYPFAGVSLSDIRGWKLGLDVGLGTDYAVAPRIDMSAGLKWLVRWAGRPNPVVVWLGTTFKF